MDLMLALCDLFWAMHLVADFTVIDDTVLAPRAPRRIRLLVRNMCVALIMQAST